MKIEIGNYVRYKRGNVAYGIEPPERIAKVINRINNSDILQSDVKQDILESDVIKASDKLIDLIECGDYVNGYKVTGKDDFSIGINLLNEYEQNWEWLCEDEIQTIVTKEQFEKMAYKVGD